MNIQDIRQGNSVIVVLRLNEPVKLPMHTPVRLIQEGNGVGVIPLQKGLPPMLEALVEADYLETLTRLLSRNMPCLSSVVDVSDLRLTIDIKTFPDQKPMDLSVGIEDDFMRKVKKRASVDDSSPELKLNQAYVMEINGLNYAVLGVHAQAKSKNDGFDHFILAGSDSYIRINRKTDAEENRYFVADSIQSRIKEEDYTFLLIKGKIGFVNATRMEQARLATLAAMSELGSSSYLAIWEEYDRIEQKFMFEQAKRAGVLAYSGWDYDGVRGKLFVENRDSLSRFSQALKDEEIYLTLCEGDPSELLNGDPSTDRYEWFKRNEKKMCIVRLADRIFPDEGRIYIDRLPEEHDFADRGFAFLSIEGDMERFKRRSEARDSILKGTNYMPGLAAILDGRSVAPPVRQRIEPISPAVKQDIFPIHDPTPIQKEAIDVAINTPDIALIQGPPGTGKTTVILAILKRLNELSGSGDGLFGRNLISAYQHDAVQNAVERVEIMGLPAIKLGQSRRSASTDEIHVIERMIGNWLEDKKTKLQEQYPDLAKDRLIDDYDNLYNSYLYSANTIENTIHLLTTVQTLLHGRLSADLILELERVLAELKRSGRGGADPEREFLLKCIRRIPCSDKAYRDNGKNVLFETVYRLKREASKKTYDFAGEIPVLESVMAGGEPAEADLERLRTARSALLVKVIPEEDIFSTPQQKEDVLILLAMISDELRDQYNKTRFGEDAVIREYIAEFENSPLAVQNTVLDYVSVLGATNQQVVGRAVARYKGEKAHYDNVLVDEAARSNPLDLFIPLSLAKDRIILVGDHRQLPHIVDDNIVSQIEDRYAEDGDEGVMRKVNESINQSMFQVLFHTLKQLEKKDGIKRTVTLNKQYRTHRVLGEFVSRNFYEKHNDGYIDSPLPDSLFTHSLPGLENKACVWMDVPYADGGEQGGQSKSRRIEAVRIASHLKRMMDSEASAGLNFGIIAFYRKQVDVIYEELAKLGIAYKTDSGGYAIAEEYREVLVKGKRVERLRIGTVDAFQGMEFDVVYLSMVRSNLLPSGSESDNRRKYGHLMVENRLCVSMSRQKRMLISVGDSGMLRAPGAESAVPALVNYYSLCQSEEQYGQLI